MAKQHDADGANSSKSPPPRDNAPEIPFYPPDQEGFAASLLTLLLRGGEAVVAPQYPANILKVSHATPKDGEDTAVPNNLTALLRVLEQIETLLQQDTQLAALVAALPQAFGDGELLQFLFWNLFPEQQTQVASPKGRPLLTPREVETLNFMAKDMTYKEIAKEMVISPQTVNKHLSHIYRKLGVKRPMQAVAQAAAQGYIHWDSLFFGVRCQARYGGVLQDFCINIGGREMRFTGAEVGPWAGFGLLLLGLSGAVARQRHGDLASPPPQGGLYKVKADGTLYGPFTTEGMGVGRSIVIAPDRTDLQGFTPGNLFVAHDLKPQQGLNRGAISEFTPQGNYVRSFCGSSEVGTRIVGPLSLAFAADGRLLASSGWLTDAVLAFSEGGTVVSRVFEGSFIQVVAHANGSLFGLRRLPHADTIQVFDSQGQPSFLFEAYSAFTDLFSIALASDGRVFATWGEQDRRILIEYDAKGRLIYDARGDLPRRHPVSGYVGGHLAIDEQDNIYMPCPLEDRVTVLSSNGAIVRHIALNGCIRPKALAPCAGGSLWVCGQISSLISHLVTT